MDNKILWPIIILIIIIGFGWILYGQNTSESITHSVESMNNTPPLLGEDKVNNIVHSAKINKSNADQFPIRNENNIALLNYVGNSFNKPINSDLSLIIRLINNTYYLGLLDKKNSREFLISNINDIYVTYFRDNTPIDIQYTYKEDIGILEIKYQEQCGGGHFCDAIIVANVKNGKSLGGYRNISITDAPGPLPRFEISVGTEWSIIKTSDLSETNYKEGYTDIDIRGIYSEKHPFMNFNIDGSNRFKERVNCVADFHPCAYFEFENVRFSDDYSGIYLTPILKISPDRKIKQPEIFIKF